MRTITRNAVNGFMNARPFNSQNTQVVVFPNVTVLKLFGNKIAYRYNDPERTLSITTCGWDTATTKERLNALPGVKIRQKAGILYLNGKEWNGNLIDVEQKQ